LGVAESLTGGLIASRFVAVPGASAWFRGGVVSYASEVKRSLLGVPPGPVVSADAAIAMATGVTRAVGSSVGLAVTGVAGPTEQEGQPVGTIWVAVTLDGHSEALEVRGVGDRERIRQLAAITSVDLLRRRLMARHA
jgi:PncC family amidohydrolase